MSTTTSAPSSTPPVAAVLLFIVVGIAVLCLAFLSRFNGFSVYDDAYDYVRFADHILAGHGMTWNVGEGALYGVPSLAYVFAVIPFRLLFPGEPAAAIFSASFFWGMVLIALLFRLAIRVMAPSKMLKVYVMGLVMVSLLATAGSLRSHFASGMETTFVMAFVAMIVGMLESLRQGKGNAWLMGGILGMGWWIRPDMLFFTIGLPVVLLVLDWQKSSRGLWMRVLLVSLAGTVICLLGAFALTGSYLPTSYGIKSSELYGTAYLTKMRWQTIGEATRFLSVNWPPLVLIGMGIYLKWRRLREGYRTMDLALIIVAGTVMLYLSFFVLQTMNFGQRYYFPLQPLLIYLACRELIDLPESLRLGPGLHFKRIPTNFERGAVIALAGLLLYYGIDYVQAMKQSKLSERFGIFSTEEAYDQEFKNYWVHLGELRSLPNTLRIATTEIGIPSALLPDNVIDDLTSFNSAEFQRDGLSATSLLQHCPADLIYLPFAQYAPLAKSLDSSAAFNDAYTVFSAKEIDGLMGVAIRNQSPFSASLKAIFLK